MPVLYLARFSLRYFHFKFLNGAGNGFSFGRAIQRLALSPDMKSARLEFPTVANWSCHGCTDCCRGRFLVPLTAADQARLQAQGWTAADGVDPDGMFQQGRGQTCLGHHDDGACVFLDPAGRCRIHAKFGEAAKPLACRLYPLAIHPAGDKLVVGLHFSCPSVVANAGKPLPEQAPLVKKLAAVVVPENYQDIPPAPVLATPGEWPDFLRFVHWLDVSLTPADVPVALKLLRSLHWLRGIERGCLDQISGESADEILDALVGSVAEKVPAMPGRSEKPSRFGRLFLRLMVLEHARQVRVEQRHATGAQRWRMLGAAFRFARSGGWTPDLDQELKRVPFAAIETDFGPLTPASEAMLTRFFRIKVQSLHFCGRAFHDRPLIEGFRHLAMLYPVIIWLARWFAVSGGRNALTDADVAKAVSRVDYHHGFSPYLPWRTRLLQQREDITRLCAWYGRQGISNFKI